MVAEISYTDSGQDQHRKADLLAHQFELHHLELVIKVSSEQAGLRMGRSTAPYTHRLCQSCSLTIVSKASIETGHGYEGDVSLERLKVFCLLGPMIPLPY